MPPVSEDFEDNNTPEARGKLLDLPLSMPTEEQEQTFKQIQARMVEAVQQRIRAGEERIRVGEELIADQLLTYVSILQCIGAPHEDIVLEGLEFASIALCEFKHAPYHPFPTPIRLQAAKMLRTAFRQLDEQDRLQKQINHEEK